MEPRTESTNILNYHFEYKNGTQLDVDSFTSEQEKAFAQKCSQVFVKEQHQQIVSDNINQYLLEIEPYDPPYPVRSGLNALRLHYLWVVSDALKRSLQEDETIRLLTSRQPEGEHNLLENIMSIWARWDQDNQSYVLDTGVLSKEQYWTSKVGGVLELIMQTDSNY